MIKRIKRSALDLEKYTACLQRATNYRVYAEYWYLDILCGEMWDCYVLNDYEAIMPLPYIRKFGIKFIAQPVYCQQLGVFHSENFTQDLFDLFEKKLHRNLVKGYYFNEENLIFQQKNKQTKINQILNLTIDYSLFYRQLRKNRKQELAKGLPTEFQIVSSSQDLHFIDLLEEEYHEIKSQLYLHQLKPLAAILQQKKLTQTVSIVKDNEVVASSFYIKSGNRIIQLCNAKKSGYSINFNTYIVDFIIKSNLNKNLILDFEGSTLKGVHEFNQSFRAETKHFTIYQNLIFKR